MEEKNKTCRKYNIHKSVLGSWQKDTSRSATTDLSARQVNAVAEIIYMD